MVCFEDTQCCTDLPGMSRQALPAAWAGISADLVEAIEDREFPGVFTRSLADLISFDRCALIVYDGGNKPIPIGRDGPNGAPATAVRPDGRYRLHPFYPLHRAGVTSGAYLSTDLAGSKRPDAEESSFGLSAGNTELCIVLPMSAGCCVMVSLTRSQGGPEFDDDDVERAKLVLPFLTSVFRRYWQSVGAQAHRQGDNADRKLLQRIGRLSPREKEIVGLLMDGHSTLSISLRLDISGTTVKTHRKNLYSKLGVGTLYELFSLYGDSIKHQMTHSY